LVKRGHPPFGIAAVAAAILAVAGTVLVGSAPGASAAVSCDTTNHCYAESVSSGAANYGVYGYVYIGCSYMPDSGSNFVTSEMWDTGSANAYWTEVGVFSGLGDYHSWFWADSRPNGGGFNLHFPNLTAAGTGGTYTIEINYIGSNDWDIYEGNSFTDAGESTAQPPSTSSGTTIAGSEYTANSGFGMRDIGNVAYEEYQNTGGTWHYVGGTAANEDIGTSHYVTSTYDSGTSTIDWTGPC
jgi:hypothetical protein